MLSEKFIESLREAINSHSEDNYSPPIIFHGAGVFAAQFSKELEKLGIHPVCYSDKDTSKHGTMLNGKKVLSVKEAIATFPDYLLLITTMPENWDVITDYLIESGISQDRIINKIMIDNNPGLVQWGCDAIFTKFYMRCEVLSFCCVHYNERWSKLDNQNYDKSIDDFIEMRADTLSTFNSDEKHSLCKGCPYLKKQVWVFDKIRSISLVHENVCNVKCVYCSFVNNSKMGKLPTPAYSDLSGQVFR